MACHLNSNYGHAYNNFVHLLPVPSLETLTTLLRKPQCLLAVVTQDHFVKSVHFIYVVSNFDPPYRVKALFNQWVEERGEKEHQITWQKVITLLIRIAVLLHNATE